MNKLSITFKTVLFKNIFFQRIMKRVKNHAKSFLHYITEATSEKWFHLLLKKNSSNFLVVRVVLLIVFPTIGHK